MRLTAIVACSAALLAAGSPAALAGSDLYAAQTIVTGTDMRNRPHGMAVCLREVLVKVSGNPRLAEEPRVDALARNADQLVADFTYHDRMSGIPRHDEQGSRDRPYDLAVRFDPAKIDQSLAGLGEHPWGVDRPSIRPHLQVTNGGGRTFVLRAGQDEGREHLEALAAAADRFGLSLSLSGAASQDVARQVPVRGALVWSDRLRGWVGSWHLDWRKRRYAWQVRGGNFDAAFRNLMRGCLQILSGHGAPPPVEKPG